jgi:hypothetical protein
VTEPFAVVAPVVTVNHSLSVGRVVPGVGTRQSKSSSFAS